jgi:hypothetical protein
MPGARHVWPASGGEARAWTDSTTRPKLPGFPGSLVSRAPPATPRPGRVG